MREVPINFTKNRTPCLQPLQPAFRVWVTPSHFLLRGHAVQLETTQVDDITDLARCFCRQGHVIAVDGDQVSLARIITVLDALAGEHCRAELQIESKAIHEQDLCCG